MFINYKLGIVLKIVSVIITLRNILDTMYNKMEVITNEYYFDTHWPWMGIGIACVLIILLFFTNTLRSDLRVNRWYDPFWLAWFSSTAYFIHNFEEYGIDLFGRHFEFPHLMTQTMHITPEISFFTMINIPLIWIAGPILAMMSKHRPVISLIMTGLMFTNALSHIVPLISSGMYTSGLFTSIVIFYSWITLDLLY